MRRDSSHRFRGGTPCNGLAREARRPPSSRPAREEPEVRHRNLILRDSAITPEHTLGMVCP